MCCCVSYYLCYALVVTTHRGPHPLHIPRFGGMGGELLEAQGWRLTGEIRVFEQAAGLQTFLLQRLVVLVGEVYGLLLGAHAFRS